MESNKKGPKEIPYYVIQERVEKVERIIGKSIVDPKFRNTLFECPGAVAREYELDEDVLRAVTKEIDQGIIAELGNKLQARITKDAAAIIFCAVV